MKIQSNLHVQKCVSSCWFVFSFLIFFISGCDNQLDEINAVVTNAEKLGFPAGKKVLLLHMDDLGMCEGANRSAEFYIENEFVISGSVMIPCPKAGEFIEWVKNHPEADIGAHLTLSSDWQKYRWGPVVKSAKTTGLVDQEGNLWPSVPEVILNATPEEVENEIRAQINNMIEWGVTPAHIDTHMGTLYGSVEFLNVYLKIAEEYGIPANVVDISNVETVDYYKKEGFSVSAETINLINRYNLPKLDHFTYVPKGTNYKNKKAAFFDLINNLKPGLTEIVFHPSAETEMIKDITSLWQQRVWEAKLFSDPEVILYLADNEIIITNWKEIMERFNN